MAGRKKVGPSQITGQTITITLCLDDMIQELVEVLEAKLSEDLAYVLDDFDEIGDIQREAAKSLLTDPNLKERLIQRTIDTMLDPKSRR